jgi:hypothetical protein
MKNLWATALNQNKSFNKIKKAIEKGKRRFPLKLKLQVTIAECSLNEGERPQFRERLWVSDYESLRIKIIQNTHDSEITDHSDYDLLISILSRRFYWPELSQNVRCFIQNCDECDSKKLWCEKKWDLLKSLPISKRIW